MPQPPAAVRTLSPHLLAGLHAGLALLVVPALRPHPFSAPKLALLAAGAVGFAVLALRERARGPLLPRLLGLGWLLLTVASALSSRDPAPDALLLDASAALLLLALLSSRVETGALLRALAWIGAAVACVVLVQAPGPGPRLRMFGTLGNPDFCAAWLAVSLCAAVAEARGRPRLWLLAAPQAAALLCIGSFATALALGAAALVAVRSRLVLSGVAVAALCVAAAARDPARVARGRARLHAVAAAHLLDAPLTGLGPGSVRALWPLWDPAGAPQDHVHDDFLERAVEQGLPSAVLLAALAALALATAFRRARREPRLAPVAAGLAALSARALVDFPLARPAELALFVTLAALSFQEESPCTSSP